MISAALARLSSSFFIHPHFDLFLEFLLHFSRPTSASRTPRRKHNYCTTRPANSKGGSKSFLKKSLCLRRRAATKHNLGASHMLSQTCVRFIKISPYLSNSLHLTIQALPEVRVRHRDLQELERILPLGPQFLNKLLRQILDPATMIDFQGHCMISPQSLRFLFEFIDATLVKIPICRIFANIEFLAQERDALVFCQFATTLLRHQLLT